MRRRVFWLEPALLAVSRVEDGLQQAAARLNRLTLRPLRAARRELLVVLARETFPELVPGAPLELNGQRYRLIQGPFWCEEIERIEVKAVRLDDLKVWTHLTPRAASEALVRAREGGGR